MEMTETQEIGIVRAAHGASNMGDWLWVVVERIALKRPTNVAPSALFERKRKSIVRGAIGIREDTMWARCLDLKIWPSTGKGVLGLWIASMGEETATRFHLTPSEYALTFVSKSDSAVDRYQPPHGFVYRVSVFFSEHYARCYLEGKNPGKGRDGDI